MTNPAAKKVLLVLTSTFPRWRGDTTPAFVLELSQQLKSIYKVIVIAPHSKGAKTNEWIDDIEVIRFRYFFESGEKLAYGAGLISNLKKNPFNIILLPLFFLSQIITIKRVINKMNIYAVHAHWLIPQGISAAIARLFCKKTPRLICTMHGSDLKLPLFFFKPIYSIIFSSADALVTVSHSLQNQALNIGAPSNKIHVIPMGFDIEKKFTIQPESVTKKKNLLFVGRLIKKKGVDVLLRALADVVAVLPQIQAVIVGDGPERPFLVSMAEQLKLANNVTFVGAKSHQELIPYYQAAAIFVSPTLSEGFGLTLAEALACGCAVIVSDLPEVADIITHQQTGLTFKPGDNAELARRIIALLEDPFLCQSLAEKGREKVKAVVAWNCILPKYEALFDGASLLREVADAD